MKDSFFGLEVQDSTQKNVISDFDHVTSSYFQQGNR